jgi:hypothetical protein
MSIGADMVDMWILNSIPLHLNNLRIRYAANESNILASTLDIHWFTQLPNLLHST